MQDEIMQDELMKKAQGLRMILTRVATGKDERGDSSLYSQLRTDFVLNRLTKSLLPEFVLSCRVLSDFWPYIKNRYGTYSERREFIREQLEPLLSYLEGDKLSPHDNAISDSISSFNCDSVTYMWEKALDRKEIDPDGAITVARSLIESVCKQILVERNIAYDDSHDLPKLFKATARSLNLAPQLHKDSILKQILSGVQTTICGFASLRNGLSDVHGQPKGSYRASKRHAEFAVNLSGSVASFLIQTHQEIMLKSTSN